MATREYVLGELQRERRNALDCHEYEYAAQIDQEITRLSAGTATDPLKEHLSELVPDSDRSQDPLRELRGRREVVAGGEAAGVRGPGGEGGQQRAGGRGAERGASVAGAPVRAGRGRQAGEDADLAAAAPPPAPEPAPVDPVEPAPVPVQPDVVSADS